MMGKDKRHLKTDQTSRESPKTSHHLANKLIQCENVIKLFIFRGTLVGNTCFY